ncbi:Imidazoleglycerol-phosphate dehydratase [Cynara cardunculus var. scolymus]|uniref:Imidazoleglycerol-phosphate dehydratase n=1 Tax=Cynara cardunculus var. scolymus TaxID=59895 RepID=A0A103YF63_CYNCS|nr:Imidazoleglycerol-phosphate dehydratase [Cynara cardunculus var. scolymus]
MDLSVPHRCVVHSSSSCCSSQLLKPRFQLVPTPNQIKHPLVSINQRYKFYPMEVQRTTGCSASSLLNDHGSPITADPPVDTVRDRIGSVKRVTNETNVFVELNLDGVGSPDSSTGIPFLDHMLDVILVVPYVLFARHNAFLQIHCTIVLFESSAGLEPMSTGNFFTLGIKASAYQRQTFHLQLISCDVSNKVSSMAIPLSDTFTNLTLIISSVWQSLTIIKSLTKQRSTELNIVFNVIARLVECRSSNVLILGSKLVLCDHNQKNLSDRDEIDAPIRLWKRAADDDDDDESNKAIDMQLASHGLFDVHVKAVGDTHIDDHHTNEDVALAIGTALLGALGDRKGINRFGDFTAPLDEALVHVALVWSHCNPKRVSTVSSFLFVSELGSIPLDINASVLILASPLGSSTFANLMVCSRLVASHSYYFQPCPYFKITNKAINEERLVEDQDLSGRPHLNYDLHIPTERVGTYDTQLVEHFFQSLVNTSGMTLHIRQLAGKNSHHIIEATFKAFARALRQATEYDPRRRGTVPRGEISM